MTLARFMSGFVPALALLFGTTAAAFPQNYKGQAARGSQIDTSSAYVAAISPGDTATNNDVSAALDKDKSLRIEDIKVQTILGVVTLTGAVESNNQSQRAQQIASSVKGVKAVNNHLTIITLSSEQDSGNAR